jgi:3-oxoacyl-[acyl-carrier protein] reductase
MSLPTVPELHGLTAVVTGASSGIGQAVALELAAAGAAVLVHARQNRAGAEHTAGQIEAAGGAARVVLADLALAGQPARLVDDAWSWRQGFDIWVNNAGADVLTGPAAHWPFERKLDALWQVDVRATIELAREAGRRLRQRGGGAIVNVGWDQAATGMAGDSGELFAAAKGAVAAFTRSLACSLAPQVRVNCVAPGWIRTAWGDQASADWQRRAVREALLARWGTPRDVAQVVRFLVSPAAGFITGQVLPVNGGARAS